MTANAYYIHPIIAPVAEHFGVSDAMIGMVPALNQLALALGILLLLPLGDWLNNRRLVSIFSLGQFFSILGMAFSENYTLFVLSSTILGFFTIAPYIIPSYVSKRVAPERLGHATAIITMATIVGILIARAGSGLIAEHFGWRIVYIVASCLMLSVTLVFPFLLEQGERTPGKQSYFGLLSSLPAIIRSSPHVFLSGVIQGLNFGGFLGIWMGIGLHLTSPEMGYGVDVVGYLAILALVNMYTTPKLGKWADRIRPRRARFMISVIGSCAVFLYLFVGHNIWLLMIPILLSNIVGPTIDVSGRMITLAEPENVRTRLMTVYIILMFVGGGIGSWVGTAAYDWGGWIGTVTASFALTATATCLSAYSYYSQKQTQ